MSDIEQRIKFYLEYIKEHEEFTALNAEKLEIYEGCLLPKILKVLEATLSKNYYDHIKDRVLPINVLTRIIDKLSKVYNTEPSREVNNESDQKGLEFLETELDINLVMSMADEYSHLFKGYALEPFIDEGKAGVRVLPYDRFLVIGQDPKNPLKVTDFIKFMGERTIRVADGQKKVKVYHAYTKDEFIPFDSDGNLWVDDLDGNDGVNPYGRIPFVYGNRSRQTIIPTQDTDIIQLTKMIPVLLSDMGGAIMFQCFSIIYGIDLNMDNIVLSPNAIWNFKSDVGADMKPTVGTIKPEADVDKVLTFIKSTFAFWLETKGVRVGSLNSMDANNMASGISKIIDEMDVFEIKKKQIGFFKSEEKDLWDLLKIMNNYWVKNEEGYEGKLLSEDFKPKTVFDEPRPEIPWSEQVATKDKEVKAGFLDRETAIRELYPDLSDDEVKARLARIDSERAKDMPEENDRDENGGEEKKEEQLDVVG
jgi:hypothetical protein